jgi:hypothetical protein
VADSWLHEAVCRHRPEFWPTVAYIKLCVDTDLNIDYSWLHEAVCRHILELWPTVGYIKLCVDTDLNSGLQLVT